MIGLFPDLLPKKLQDIQKYPSEVSDNTILSPKDTETGQLWRIIKL